MFWFIVGVVVLVILIAGASNGPRGGGFGWWG